MGDLALASWILAALLLAGLIAALVVVARRFAIRWHGGTVECGIRQAGDVRWRSGIAVYRPGQLCWFRSCGIRLRPDAVYERQALRLVGGRTTGSAAGPGPGRTTIVVQFAVGSEGEPLWLAMGEDALTGFLAWLEAGSPRSVPGLLG
jgi:Protein of unknown function (DUF2550)